MRFVLSALLISATFALPSFAQDEPEEAEESNESSDSDEATEDNDEPAAPAASGATGDAQLAASTDDGAGWSVENPVGRTQTFRGPTGLFRMLTADSAPAGTFSLGLFGEFFSGADVVRQGDDNSRFVGRLALTYTPIEWLEVHASLSGQGNANSHADPVLIQTLGDLQIGAKGFADVGSGLAAGGALALNVFNAEDAVGLDFSATSIDIRGLLDYSLQKSAGVPLDFHLNLGVFIDNTPELFTTDDGRILELQRVERFAHSVSDYHRFNIGLGVEAPLEYVTPFVEWNLGIPFGPDDLNDCATVLVPCPGDAGFSSFPDVLTLGVKGTPLDNLSLNLGVDIGLTSDEATGIPAVAPYNVLFGLAYLVDPSGGEPEVVYVETQLPPPPTGWILGEVVAGDSTEPVAGATITYPGTDYTPQSTDPETGRFRSYEFPVGSEIAVEISHPNFEGREFNRAIIEGQDGIRIRLQPGNIGTVAGQVTDAGGVPLPATVFARGPIEAQFEVDPLTGEFSQQLDNGDYVITIFAEGHVSDRQQITVAGLMDHTVSLDPRPEEQVAVLKGDRIDFAGESIIFDDGELDDASKELLDQVAQLMADHPDLRVQVTAHTDDEGTVAETEEQAQMVVDYLLEAGVDTERLEPMGMGSDQPLVPNISNRNRRRNRRVELLLQ